MMPSQPGPVKALTPAFRVLSMRRMRKSLVALAIFLLASTHVTAAPTGVIETIPAAGAYVVNSDRVNVRVAPDAQQGKVVGTLNKGASVEVVEMTVLTFVVQGMRSAWFHIRSPEGWVYGYFLDPADSPTRTGSPPGFREEH